VTVATAQGPASSVSRRARSSDAVSELASTPATERPGRARSE